MVATALSAEAGTATFRITSYNVCYTKLLRLLELAGRTGREGAERLPDEVLGALVEAAGAKNGSLGCGETLLAKTVVYQLVSTRAADVIWGRVQA